MRRTILRYGHAQGERERKRGRGEPDATERRAIEGGEAEREGDCLLLKGDGEREGEGEK